MASRRVVPPSGMEILDRETGEQVQDNWANQRPTTTCRTNAETGEVEQTPSVNPQTERRRPFQVPKKALNNYHHLKQRTGFPDQMLELANKLNESVCPEYYYPLRIEQKLLGETRNISPAVFLIPTLFLFPFPAWLTVITIIIELCLHMWAHKTNKHCKDSHLRYRSPLHAFTSQFCALCNSKRSMQKIGRLQDARALKVYSRKPKYCTYVEKVSVVT